MSATVETETEMFVELPSSGKERLLHPSRVTEWDDAQVVLSMNEVPEGVATGETRMVYFALDGGFVKQPGEIGAIQTGEDGVSTVAVALMGEPASAEQRQDFRVSCIGCDITAKLDRESGCRVIDTSASGFAVTANQALQTGAVRDVTLFFDGESYAGRAAVQSVRRLPTGEHRYGMVAVDGTWDKGLVRGLPGLSAKIQRAQLRRVR